jgi:hypothetical protein
MLVTVGGPYRRVDVKEDDAPPAILKANTRSLPTPATVTHTIWVAVAAICTVQSVATNEALF